MTNTNAYIYKYNVQEHVEGEFTEEYVDVKMKWAVKVFVISVVIPLKMA